MPPLFRYCRRPHDGTAPLDENGWELRLVPPAQRKPRRGAGRVSIGTNERLRMKPRRPRSSLERPTKIKNFISLPNLLDLHSPIGADALVSRAHSITDQTHGSCP